MFILFNIWTPFKFGLERKTQNLWNFTPAKSYSPKLPLKYFDAALYINLNLFLVPCKRQFIEAKNEGAGKSIKRWYKLMEINVWISGGEWCVWTKFFIEGHALIDSKVGHIFKLMILMQKPRP